jgi:hypothetical protein
MFGASKSSIERERSGAQEETPSHRETAPKRKPTAVMRALVCVSTACILGVIEIVFFSQFAAIYGVAVDIKSMPTNWAAVYYLLWFLPGFFLFLAVVNISTIFEW